MKIPLRVLVCSGNLGNAEPDKRPDGSCALGNTVGNVDPQRLDRDVLRRIGVEEMHTLHQHVLGHHIRALVQMRRIIFQAKGAGGGKRRTFQ